MRNKNPGLLVIIGLAALTVAWATVPFARAIFIPEPVPTPAPPDPPVPPQLPPPNPTPDPIPTSPPIMPPPCHETPEPATLLSGLVGGGLLSLIAYRKRRKAAQSAGSVFNEVD